MSIMPAIVPVHTHLLIRSPLIVEGKSEIHVTHDPEVPADFRTLQKRGFSVFAFDAHSFGKSEPLAPPYLRSYVLTPQHLVDDVYTYVEVDNALHAGPLALWILIA